MIVEFGGKYLIWCIQRDAPKTKLMTRFELQQTLVGSKGGEALMAFNERMERVHCTGTSSTRGLTKEELLTINRAGEDGSAITSEREMAKAYG